MQTYELTVTNRVISPNSDDVTLVRTSVGVDEVHVYFDSDEWVEFPLTVTVSSDSDSITQSLSASVVSDSEEWSAEATFRMPWEPLRAAGPLRITIQGTDNDGNHIITARGTPLVVEEAGDVTLGDVPEGAPTINQYQQVYNDAIEAIRDIRAEIDGLSDFVTFDDVAEVDGIGLVKPDGITITVADDGTISGASQIGVATANEAGIVRPDGTSIVMDEDGTIHAMSVASAISSIPVATGDSIGGVRLGDDVVLDGEGMLHVRYFTNSEIDALTPMDTFAPDRDEMSF